MAHHPHAADGTQASPWPEVTSLRDYLVHSRRLPIRERAAFFAHFVNERRTRGESPHGRIVRGATDRSTSVTHIVTGVTHEVLMFGSNSYLGLTTHPHVKAAVRRALDDYGAGMAGPPLLNGRSALHRELEERLADFKGMEEACLFTSGYNANVGMVSALLGRRDYAVADALHHASFVDGVRLSGASHLTFPHNDAAELERTLDGLDDAEGGVLVGVEGVYSMDGDLAPLDALARACAGRPKALFTVDDAHGTGVMGPNGRGTCAHFGVTDQVDLILTTFSKAFGVAGGAIAGSADLVDYLRYQARSHMFSAALPPTSVAAVLAGLDIMEREPERRERLHHNVAYLAERLRQLGLAVPESAGGILVVGTVPGLDVRHVATRLHQRGIFLNAIEFPAVPPSQERLRISVMATHTEADLDTLVATLAAVWDEMAPAEHRLSRLQSGAASGDGLGQESSVEVSRG